jgi:hypothetical protein
MKNQNIQAKPIVLVAGLALATGCLLAAEADLKTEVKSAAKKLAEKGNYSWTSTTKNEAAGGGQQRPQMAPMTGKIDKEGCILVTMKRQDDTTFEAVVKGEKIALKTDEGWQSGEELRQAAAGGRGRGGFMARGLQNMKPPAVQAADFADKAKELKKAADGCYGGDLTEDAAKELLMLGRGARGAQGGQAPPPPVGAKATVKFWLKDGALVKYEYNVQGKVTFRDQEREVNRTTTVELKDVGTTKFEVPEEAKKKVS